MRIFGLPVSHVVVIAPLAIMVWAVVIGAGEVLWHAALGVHRLVAGM